MRFCFHTGLTTEGDISFVLIFSSVLRKRILLTIKDSNINRISLKLVTTIQLEVANLDLIEKRSVENLQYILIYSLYIFIQE